MAHRLAGSLDLDKAFRLGLSLAMAASHQDNQDNQVSRRNSKVNLQDRLQLVLAQTSKPHLLLRKLPRNNLSLRA
jgi:hypothetical protein